MKEKINQLIATSKQVLQDCILPNGAIVAANSDLLDYSAKVQNYRYVWPRDAAFVMVAADLLNLEGVHERFVDWLEQRAEAFSETGMLYQNYYVNGPKRWLACQPDQMGLLLWALHEHIKQGGDAEKFKPAITTLANTITGLWDEDHFNLITQDLWEENYTYPEDKTVHTFSAAMCCSGLKMAYQLFGEQQWKECAQKIQQTIEHSYQKRFFRTLGDLPDTITDASLLGLSYPANLYPAHHEYIEATVADIEQKIGTHGVLLRYEHDRYDSYRQHGFDGRRGAGWWPVLNLWIAIHYARKGNKSKALSYYLAVVDAVDTHIPEQIFSNKKQQSVSPLAWSHAMFVIASNELGFLKKE